MDGIPAVVAHLRHGHDLGCCGLAVLGRHAGGAVDDFVVVDAGRLLDRSRISRDTFRPPLQPDQRGRVDDVGESTTRLLAGCYVVVRRHGLGQGRRCGVVNTTKSLGSQPDVLARPDDGGPPKRASRDVQPTTHPEPPQPETL
jgi:hypothetical protein